MIMPNEQCVAVKCDIKSRGRDVFDMVVAHANLVEHFYFGLAFIDGNAVLCVSLMTERESRLYIIHTLSCLAKVNNYIFLI